MYVLQTLILTLLCAATSSFAYLHSSCKCKCVLNDFWLVWCSVLYPAICVNIMHIVEAGNPNFMSTAVELPAWILAAVYMLSACNIRVYLYAAWGYILNMLLLVYWDPIELAALKSAWLLHCTVLCYELLLCEWEVSGIGISSIDLRNKFCHKLFQITRWSLANHNFGHLSTDLSYLTRLSIACSLDLIRPPLCESNTKHSQRVAISCLNINMGLDQSLPFAD